MGDEDVNAAQHNQRQSAGPLVAKPQSRHHQRHVSQRPGIGSQGTREHDRVRSKRPRVLQAQLLPPTLDGCKQRDVLEGR